MFNILSHLLPEHTPGLLVVTCHTFRLQVPVGGNGAACVDCFFKGLMSELYRSIHPCIIRSIHPCIIRSLITGDTELPRKYVDDKSLSVQPYWHVPKARTGNSHETRPQYLILCLTWQGKSSMNLQLVVCWRPIDRYFDPFSPGHSKVILEVWCKSPGPPLWAPGSLRPAHYVYYTLIMCGISVGAPECPTSKPLLHNCNNCHQLTICGLTHLAACWTNTIVRFWEILTACLWASRLPNQLLCCLSGVFPLSLSLSLSLCLFFKDFSFSLSLNLCSLALLLSIASQAFGETALACIWTAVHLCFHLWKGKVVFAWTLGWSTSCMRVENGLVL